MGMARVLVSFELLQEVLNLPRDTEIRHVSTGDYRCMEMVVVHPDLVDGDAGTEIPLLTPTFRKEYQSVAVFHGWNQPDQVKA